MIKLPLITLIVIRITTIIKINNVKTVIIQRLQ